MKKYVTIILVALSGVTSVQAQNTSVGGKCGKDVEWSFDRNTNILTLTAGKKVEWEKEGKPMYDYGKEENISPWRKKKLDVKKVVVGKGITSIGSCAFAGCGTLKEVEFNDASVRKIGWGAFLDCVSLRDFSLPGNVRFIGEIAFANCRSLGPKVKIPGGCEVEDKAFASCDDLTSIDLSSSATLKDMVFVKEELVGGKIQHTPYSRTILGIPDDIDSTNCYRYGLAKEAVNEAWERKKPRLVVENYDSITAPEVDENIPQSGKINKKTYALIIGNQKYREGISEVTYAIHDARVFREYCIKTLGVKPEHIHLAENATKHMIMEEELEGWLDTLSNRKEKRLIIYYAGHGVPDTRENNKSYLLPVDVKKGHPERGIALDEFYATVGDMGFEQSTIFLDACFSGVARSTKDVTKQVFEGDRADAIEVPVSPLETGNIIVFSAAKGNEAAQCYKEKGHGLFTYFLLKGLRYYPTDDNFNLGRLSDNIKNGVESRANQTPTTNASPSLSETWKSFQRF